MYPLCHLVLTTAITLTTPRMLCHCVLCMGIELVLKLLRAQNCSGFLNYCYDYKSECCLKGHCREKNNVFGKKKKECFTQDTKNTLQSIGK